MTPDPLFAALDRCRKERGWTACQLSDAAGLSRATYRYAKTGQHGLTLHSLRALAGALGLEVRLSPMRPQHAEADTPEPARDELPPMTTAQQANNRRLAASALDPQWRGRSPRQEVGVENGTRVHADQAQDVAT